MPVNLVRDADIRAISLVGKGANRKRFFLFKAEDGGESVSLGTGRIIKADDWSAVFCVVAEPGWHESAGMIGDQAIEDRWADEDEIRKAAHRFMANGGLVNKMHESLEPYGQLVENAVALADITVDGETIRKGSWYIAITPSAEGKAAIEKGEFTGVSVEGTAVRELVEKGKADEDHAALDSHMLDESGKLAKASGRALPGLDRSAKKNWVDQTGGLPDLIDRAARHLHFERGRSISAAVATAVNWAKKGCATGRAFGGKVKVSKAAQARMCKAVAEWEAKKAAARVKKAKGHAETEQVVDAYLAAQGSTQDAPTVSAVEKTLLRKIAEKVGLKPEEIEAINAEVAKADQTFGEIIAQREFDKALPDAFEAFRDAVWRAFFPPPNAEGGRDAVALISESCDEFKAWALDMLDQVPVEKAERAEALGVELDPEGSTQPASTKDGDMALTDSERQELDSLKKEVADLPGKVTAELAKALGGNAAEEKPTAESIAKRAKELAGVTDESELAKKVDKIQADIAKLAEGGTTQPTEGSEQTDVSKEASREALEKAFKREGVNPALAGVLGG